MDWFLFEGSELNLYPLSIFDSRFNMFYHWSTYKTNASFAVEVTNHESLPKFGFVSSSSYLSPGVLILSVKFLKEFYYLDFVFYIPFLL